ncbi:hypothetical protein Tco_1360387 [Tanacetum coccineum]
MKTRIVEFQTDKSLDLSVLNYPAYSSVSYLQGLLVVGDCIRCLCNSGEGLILYQAYGNLYATIGRKAHLLEDKQIRSVGVFDEVSFYTLFQAFGKLLEEIHVTWTQFGKKRDKIAALHEVTFKECVQCLETASGFVVTQSELTSDGDKTFVTVSEHNRLNETQEDSAKQQRQDYKATPSRSFFYIDKLVFKVLSVKLLGDKLYT